MAKLNVNTASREELVDVAGLKPALADSILKYREESGKIADLDALRDVPRVTSQVIDQLRDTVDFGTEAVKETTEKAAEAVATMAKAGAESTRKIGEKTLEVGSALTRGGTEATQRVVSSFVSTEKAAAERSTAAASELSGLVVSLLKEQMQANVETLQAMARVRNWSDAIELQNEFFRGNVERMTQGASRYVETMTRLLTSVASVGQRGGEEGGLTAAFSLHPCAREAGRNPCRPFLLFGHPPLATSRFADSAAMLLSGCGGAAGSTGFGRDMEQAAVIAERLDELGELRIYRRAGPPEHVAIEILRDSDGRAWTLRVPWTRRASLRELLADAQAPARGAGRGARLRRAGLRRARQDAARSRRRGAGGHPGAGRGPRLRSLAPRADPPGLELDARRGDRTARHLPARCAPASWPASSSWISDRAAGAPAHQGPACPRRPSRPAPAPGRSRGGRSRAPRRRPSRPQPPGPRDAAGAMRQKAAPSASALTTSAPRRMPPSSMTGMRPATASTTCGRARTPAGAPSSWRPPWLETITASTPSSAARRASSGCRTPLRISGPLPQGSAARRRRSRRHRRRAAGPCGRRARGCRSSRPDSWRR